MEGNSLERARPNDVGMAATIRSALGLVTKKHATDWCRSPEVRERQKNGAESRIDGDGH